MEKDRRCDYCKQALRGRVDKRFCDYLCRSSYHNELSASSNNLIRRMNQILRKNRRILMSIKSKPIRYEDLVDMGFKFDHCTNIVREDDKTCIFCYDVGYVPLENNYFAVISKNIHTE